MSDDKKKDKGPKMIKWVKKNDVEIETNDDPANIAAAEQHGWKRKKGK